MPEETNQEEQQDNRIILGFLLMKSGGFLPFAAKKLNWETQEFRIVSVEHHFIRYGDIGVVNYVNWENVDSIVIEKSVEDDRGNEE